MTASKKGQEHAPPNGTKRPWEPDVQKGLYEVQVFPALVPGKPGWSAEQKRNVREFFGSVRAGIGIFGNDVERIAYRLRERGALMGDVAAHVMTRLVEEYERRKTEIVRREGTAAVQHARHLEIRFDASGEPSVRTKVPDEMGAGALEYLAGGIRDFFAPVGDAGYRDERIWWMVASELLIKHFVMSRMPDVLGKRWDLGENAPIGGEAAATEGAAPIPDAVVETLVERDGHPYLTVLSFLARDYLRALESGPREMDDAQLETLMGVRPNPARATLPMLRTEQGHLDHLAWYGYIAFSSALAQNTFDKAGETWPTAELRGSRGVIGHAVMRPPQTDRPGLIDPEQVEHWAAEMWRQRSELSDLHADVLDALTAVWISRSAWNPERLARVVVDEIIRLRSPNAKKNSEGRGQGYRPEQRQEVLQAIAHLENIWLDMGEQTVIEEQEGSGRPRKVKKQLHSRAIVVTDVETSLQPRLDGFAWPDAVWFRPGKVFSYFLDGPGRMVGLLAAEALRYHRSKERWEKRLTRNLSFQWRLNAHRAGSYWQPFRVSHLLRMAGEELKERRPKETRERLEAALERLKVDGVIANYQYDAATFVDPLKTPRKGQAEKWLASTVVIEPPDVVKKRYDEIAENREKKTSRKKKQGGIAEGPTLGERLRTARKAKGVSQMVLAERFGVSQAHLSQIERGRKKPTAELRARIEAWVELNGPRPVANASGERPAEI